MKLTKLEKALVVSGSTSIIGIVCTVFELLSMPFGYEFNWYSVCILGLGVIGSVIFGRIYTNKN
jgi:hypothetical protein